MVNKWKITTIILIVLSVVFLLFIFLQMNMIESFEGRNPQCFDYGEDNVRGCGIYCYSLGYGDSHITGDPTLEPKCSCSYPFNESEYG